jgi:hypothetical protein
MISATIEYRYYDAEGAQIGVGRQAYYGSTLTAQGDLATFNNPGSLRVIAPRESRGRTF